MTNVMKCSEKKSQIVKHVEFRHVHITLHLQVTEQRRRHIGGCILCVTNVVKFSCQLFKLQNVSDFKASLHYVGSSRLWFW